MFLFSNVEIRWNYGIIIGVGKFFCHGITKEQELFFCRSGMRPEVIVHVYSVIFICKVMYYSVTQQ